MEEAAKNHSGHEMVKVHIDRTPYDSPRHTSGEALYRLGVVAHDFGLFKETHGDTEDQKIEKNPSPITVADGEHFYSEKVVKIIVEGTPHDWFKPEISYAEVVKLEDPTYPQNPPKTYSVKYKHGPNHKPEGILTPGAHVKVKDGMVFNVSETGQS